MVENSVVNMNFVIRSCSITQAVDVSLQIPELKSPYPAEEYERRFFQTPHLILCAYHHGEAVGFKAGYEREGFFYSWMGGVIPGYRKQGVAQLLADEQEKWAKEQAYNSITFKTRNVHKGMLIFALKNGFNIIGVDEYPDVSANRIWLKKVL
jgi:predicted GNAT superfamily acetyltransferase